jgi:UDP-N-acetylmuramate dehydrogenase
LQKHFERVCPFFYEKYPLNQKNTWRVGGEASYAYFPRERETFVALFREIFQQEMPYAIIGGGSNVLISDNGVAGHVVFTEKLHNIAVLEGASPYGIKVYADSGVSLGELLKFSLKNSLSGLEFALGIPGSLGGALVGNAGAQGKCIGTLVQSVDLLFPDGGVRKISGKDIRWKYRFSSLSEKPCVLLGCVLEFHKKPFEILQKNLAVFAEKRRGQPITQKTAGSVFKNPEGDFAGRLLDISGCKGMISGGARVSLQHANFIENHNEASSQDILNLIFLCRDRVRENTGISLYPEVRFVGFEDSEILFT